MNEIGIDVSIRPRYKVPLIIRKARFKLDKKDAIFVKKKLTFYERDVSCSKSSESLFMCMYNSIQYLLLF